MHARTTPVAVRRIGSEAGLDGPDPVAIEEPLEIRLRYVSGESPSAAAAPTQTSRATPQPGQSHSDEHVQWQETSLAITMRTPGDDHELVAGFLLTEGIVTSHSQISGVRELDTNIFEAQLSVDARFDAAQLQRNFYVTSSCGVCGKASLEALKLKSSFTGLESNIRIEPGVLEKLPALMMAGQQAFLETGGLHAAALFKASGELIDIREDVGRHNAVDKIIGAAMGRQDIPLVDRVLLVSGRASFEIMQKAYMSGCSVVVAVGAPSSLAVEIAWEFDLTLVGFLRNGRCNVYAGPNRIL